MYILLCVSFYADYKSDICKLFQVDFLYGVYCIGVYCMVYIVFSFLAIIFFSNYAVNIHTETDHKNLIFNSNNFKTFQNLKNSENSTPKQYFR